MIQKKANAFHLTKNATILTLGLFMAFGTSCKKSSDSSTTLIGDWFRSNDFEGVARTEAVSFVIGDKAYVATGYQRDDIRLNDLWQYDQASGTWFQKADMPGAPRNSAVAFTIGTNGYVGTGYDGVNYLKDFYRYNSNNNTWDTIADFGGSGRTGAVAFGIGTNGYVGTGFDDNYLKDFWVYNASNNSWAQTSSLGGTKRSDAVAFTINDKAYVATGVNNGSYPDDVWQFDPASAAWTQKTRLANISDQTFDDNYTSILRSNGSAFVMNNIAYITNGVNSSVVGTTWAYDPSTDVWTQKTSFEATQRQGAVAFSINNRGYVATGNNSSSRFDDMWEFAPNNDKVDNN